MQLANSVRELAQSGPAHPDLSPTKSIRVLHCIPTLGGGGAERQLAYLSTELVKKGVDVHVAFHQPGINLEALRDSRATLHLLAPGRDFKPSLFWHVAHLIRTLKPAVVQTWLLQMDVCAGLAAMFTRTPFILTERSAAPCYPGTWKDKLRLWVGGHAALVIANSTPGREYWQNRMRPGQVKVIPNGVPWQQLRRSPSPTQEMNRIDPANELVLYAGRLSSEKNLLNLLEALQQVFCERPQAVAFLFGEGPLRSEMTQWIRSHDLEERIRMPGYSNQLWSWIKRASVLVAVSSYEGSPNVVLEASALECPLVLSDIASHRELFDAESAFFVSPSEPKQIARGVLAALENPGIARQKAICARERISEFSTTSMASEYLNLYTSLLAPNQVALASRLRLTEKI